MSTNFKKNILLTGAGFTANFGAPLAKEMWSKILNNPKIESIPEVRELLMSDFDFEQVYSDVSRMGKFSSEQKELFQKIVLEAYSDMDETLKTYVHGGFNQYGSYWSNVSRFLGSFAGSGNEVGVHFTLNQDLLLERAIQIHPLGMAASQPQYREYWDNITLHGLNPLNSIILPDEKTLEDYKTKNLSSVGNMYYVKMHGSHGWLSYTGKNQMVIGKNKVDDIESEPLLKWYFELFKEALYRKDVNLFVIGYSFRDQHVNDCLIKAIEEYNLKLYIISTEDPEKFKKRMDGVPDNYLGGSYEENSRTKKIWGAVHGYFPYRLSSIFPQDQTETQVAKDLKKLLSA